MAVQGASRADQRGPDGAVAPQERGLEMQPEEKVTMHARTHV